MIKHRRHQRQRTVGDHLFLKKAPEHEQRAALYPAKIKLVRRDQLRRKLIIPRDRALNQLRKEGNKQRKPRRILFRPVLAVMHVDQVTHRLECVKGNAQRQKQPKRLGAQRRKHGRSILEQRQYTKVEQQHRIKDHPLPLFHLRFKRLLFIGRKRGALRLQARFALLRNTLDP